MQAMADECAGIRWRLLVSHTFRKWWIGKGGIGRSELAGIRQRLPVIESQLATRSDWTDWVYTGTFRVYGHARMMDEFVNHAIVLPARIVSAMRTITVFFRFRPDDWKQRDEVT